ncbi:putative membrane protein (TIGR02234 family) [Haloactinopolyspora alba]|uniref:Putative membrane protein (TIGR02234 family) n=1 Tax=Haloactinopolyspora alba TaxID=648780 RepID=A0A2P8E3Y7_9ACTN|nr:Trp biosynthesis-associated membrane protein [Haloactinopolyspora alba]PSL04184.1 putative membrane protein (TIGR02234 family) [Haloactinopolyspora alba]
MSARRQYLITLAMLAAGGVLGLGVSSRSWGTVRMPSSLTATSTTATGSDLLPLAPAVSLVAIAAVVAVPAVRRIGRRVVGSVLVLLGAALTVMAVRTALDLDGRIESWVLRSPGTADEVGQVSTSPAWVVLLALAGAVIVAAGALVVVLGPSWPAMGARYELRRPSAGGSRHDGSAGGSADEAADGSADTDDAATDAREAWDALDRGDDPT